MLFSPVRGFSYALFGGDSVASHFQHSGSYSPTAVPQNGHCASKLTRTTILRRERVCDTVAIVLVALFQSEGKRPSDGLAVLVDFDTTALVGRKYHPPLMGHHSGIQSALGTSGQFFATAVGPQVSTIVALYYRIAGLRVFR